MKEYTIPVEIQGLLGDRAYLVNETGMSDSEVRVYDDCVLKIEPQSVETDQGYAITCWLRGRIPVPEIRAYCVADGMAFTLMSRVRGQMICSQAYLDAPELLISLVAQGLRSLWQIDVRDCPCKASRLSERLKAAEYNVLNGLVDMDNVEPDTFGPDGFVDPQALLGWLRENRPDEDIVLTHGDFCLPNVFAEGDRLSGFIDVGKMGPADRWQDIAIAIRSLGHNFSGKYTDGRQIFDFKPEMLLNALGMEMDERKFRYYILLDELF